MKKYFKYRYFMPEGFVSGKLSKVNKSNSRVYILFIFINIILFPLNFDFIVNNKVSEDEVIYENKTNYKNIESNEIIKWIDLIDKSIISVKVNNKNGELEIKNEIETGFLEENNFKVTKISYGEENKTVKVMYE